MLKLAAQAPFDLGALRVDPPRRLVEWPGGRSRLQPRAMQVLVTLAGARGSVVARDTLVTECWGQAVGDDAINRVIHLLRTLAESAGAHGFAIHTVPRIGYRLDAGEASERAPDKPLLAVLAFDNLTGDPSLGYFSDGISEEILHTISETANMRVVGRASSFALRGADKSPDRVAALLGVTHVLDGSVRRGGDMLRITAQIEACATRAPIWSGRFERPLADVFAVQDEIAAAAASALDVAFAAPSAPGPVDPVAYDLYLRALNLTDEPALPNVRLLEQATAIAPRFARAWALMAFSRAHLLNWGFAPRPVADELEAVRQEARTALTLDPAAYHAHLAMATIQPVCGHFAERRRHTAKSLSVAPNDLVVLGHVCGEYDVIGRQRAAGVYIARGYDIDPRLVGFYHAYILEAVGRSDEARAVYDRDLARWPDVLLLNANALRSAFESEDWPRYDRLAASLSEALANHPLVALVRATAERLRHWSDEDASMYLDAMRVGVADGAIVSLNLAATLCAKGRVDAIYEILEDASFAPLFKPEGRLALGDMGLNILFTPFARAMRRDPRFVDLCGKLGLCAFWAATGEWPDFAEEVAPHYDVKAEAARWLSRSRGLPKAANAR